MQGQLQCQQHRTGSEADSPLRQRQLQIRLEYRRYEPGRPHFRQLERSEPEYFRHSAGHGGRWPDRGVRRGFGICRQRDVADHRQQADGADQLQGRDQGRQYHDVEGRLTPPLLPFTPPVATIAKALSQPNRRSDGKSENTVTTSPQASTTVVRISAGPTSTVARSTASAGSMSAELRTPPRLLANRCGSFPS